MFELPIFPLHTVLFPGMPLRLVIFEERYKAMLQKVLRTNQTFGVSLIKSGDEALGPLPQPYQVGCTARIVQVDAQDDGRVNLTVIGDERFRVLHMGLNDPYLTAFVESAPLKAHHTLDVVRGMRSLRQQVQRYLALLKRYDGQPGKNGALELDVDLTGLQLPEDPMMLIYLSAALVQVPAREKQPLLEAETAARLVELVQRLYRRELAVLPPLLDTPEDVARGSAWVN